MRIRACPRCALYSKVGVCHWPRAPRVLACRASRQHHGASRHAIWALIWRAMWAWPHAWPQSAAVWNSGMSSGVFSERGVYALQRSLQTPLSTTRSPRIDRGAKTRTADAAGWGAGGSVRLPGPAGHETAGPDSGPRRDSRVEVRGSGTGLRSIVRCPRSPSPVEAKRSRHASHSVSGQRSPQKEKLWSVLCGQIDCALPPGRLYLA